MGSCNVNKMNMNTCLLLVSVINCQYGVREGNLPFSQFKLVNAVGMGNGIFKATVDSSGCYIPVFTHFKQIVSACFI
jgi:hypothetical protein